jgi:LmbE family N-acetylglucosaminyl deacetylase
MAVCSASRWRSLVAVWTLLGVLSVSAGQDVARPVDSGAAGVWQWLQKLATTASLMHTTAHPDDEHGGMLALMSRGRGARVSLLTLNRGEAGDNAIGPQLFDALGLIRTEELAVANRYYGVDRQYFTSVVDYGFSKRLEEAFDKWGRERVLADMVRVIRTERPLVIVSRFQGNARDGHGNHQAAGVLTQQAFTAAADPAMFPAQIQSGLRPWQAKALYIGGVRVDEDWSVRVDTGQYDPWLGDSYDNVARAGLAFQRSQNGGRLVLSSGAVYGYYKRIGPDAGVKEPDFFAGIDTSILGLFTALGRVEPPGAASLLQPIDEVVREALRTFNGRDPSAVVPILARGLAAARVAAQKLGAEADAALVLERKVEQFQMAINTALGLDLTAVAQPEGVRPSSTAPSAFLPVALLGPVVPGQRFDVEVRMTNRGSIVLRPESVTLDADRGWTVNDETAAGSADGPGPGRAGPTLEPGATLWRWLRVGLADDVPISSRPYFSRASIQDAGYRIADESAFGDPFTRAPTVVVRYRVGDVPVEARTVVRRREAKLPYGYVMRELRVVPVVSLTVTPATAVVPLAAPRRQVSMAVEILNNRDAGARGEVALQLPAGWTADPVTAPFAFARAGERATVRFGVAMPAIGNRAYDVRAVASVDGREYVEGFEELDFRDLEARHLYRPATASVRGIDVTAVPGLRIGYVMGIGDQVPQGIAQLGYDVTLLDEPALASSDLSRFDAIITGTRAYAVRGDLRTYNRRLLDYARNGGHLIVLYNTQELDPRQFAPFPGELTARAEEVSEEDSPVEILAPTAPMLAFPNRITLADFDGWVEQRGSKFWSAWDAAYTPIVATHDVGQAPQAGGWLWARVGKGHYTYFAYALHRQLPYGVPGGYRLLANLLALGRNGPAPF